MTPRQTLGFFALCLLASTTWLTVDLLPSTVTPTPGQGFRLLLVGAAGLFASFLGRSGTGDPSLSRCARVGLVSLGLVGIPSLMATSAQGKVPSSYGVLVFAGMPIFLTVAGSLSADSGLRPLPYSLLGLSGLLFLLPIAMPQGFAGALGFGLLLLAMVSTALSLLWLHRLLNGFPVFLAVSLTGLCNGCLLVFAGGVSGLVRLDAHGLGVEIVRGLLFDLPETILLIWLMKVIAPQRIAVRYLVTPLLTVVEGWLVLRPRFDSRMLLGLGLLGAGVWLMLRQEDGLREPTWDFRGRND